MKKLLPFVLSGVVLMSVAACGDVAKTSGEAPNTTGENATSTQTNNPEVNAQENREDATSDTRRAQIESDQRAIQQRNQNAEDLTDGDIESLVRGKLEANIPSSQLAVDSEEGVVTVAGQVASQSDLAKIKTLTQEVQGVKSVIVEAKVGTVQNNDDEATSTPSN